MIHVYTLERRFLISPGYPDQCTVLKLENLESLGLNVDPEIKGMVKYLPVGAVSHFSYRFS